MSARRSFFGIIFSLMLVLGLTACNTGNPPSGISDDFWDVHETPSSDAQAGEIHSVQEREDAPQGARGWNMIYVSEIESGTNAYVSGEVYVPEESNGQPRDIVLWNHATTGMPDECAPSRSEISDSRMPQLEQLLEDGNIVVASDYPGQGLPGPVYYMAGEPNARASLDALKALEHLPDVETTGKFVQYGLSQGAQTAVHAEAIAPEYAPDFELKGSSLMSPAIGVQDLTANAMRTQELTGFGLSILSGIETAHPDLKFDDFLTEDAVDALPEINTGCSGVWQAGTTVEEPYVDTAMQDGNAWTTAMEEIDDFTPTGTSPFIIHHGDADAIVPVDLARQEVTKLCEAGSPVEYREYEEYGHGSVVSDATQNFPAWVQDRFNDKPAKDDCS